MVKIIQTHKHIALWTGMFTLWGQSELLQGAVKEICKAARESGAIKKGAVLDFVVYVIGVDNYVRFDDSGIREYDKDDNLIGQPHPDQYITECNIDKPITTMRMNNWREAFNNGGDAVDALLEQRTDASDD